MPIIPGVGFIWVIVTIYAIAEHFATIDPLTYAFLTILGALGTTTEVWMTQLGAKVGGASIWSLLCGLILGLFGAVLALILGAVGSAYGLTFLSIGAVPGAIIGAVLGVFLAEWYRQKDWREAFKAGGGWLVGCTLSGVAQLFFSVLMIAIFIWQVARG